MEIVEKRAFLRYESSSPCELKLSDNIYKGRVVDYSDGIGAIFETTTQIESKTKVNLKIFDHKQDFHGEVVWTNQSVNSLRAGFKRDNQLKGTLKEFQLSDLLIGFQKGLKTGTLEVKSGLTTKNIYLKDGDIVFASSNSKEDRLGEILLRNSKINIDEHNHAYSLSEKKNERLGNVLIELGYLTQKELIAFIRYQLEEIISSLFAFEGTFEFYERPFKDEVTTLNTSTANIIYKSIKKIESFDYLKSFCPSKETILTISSCPQDIFQDLYLEDADKEILYYVNGFYPLELILLFSPCPWFETLKTICALLGTHFIKEKIENEPPVKLTVEEIFSEHDKETPGELAKDIENMYKKCAASGYYEILEINKNDTSEKLQKAFFRLSKKFHPDRSFFIPNCRTKRKLTKIISHINEAFNILSNPEKRTAYNLSLTKKIPKTPGIESSVTFGETAGLSSQQDEVEKSATTQEGRTQTIKTDKKVFKKDLVYLKIAISAVILTALITVTFVNINKKSERFAYIQKEQKITLPAFRDDMLEKLSIEQKKQGYRLPSFRDELFNKILNKLQEQARPGTG